MGEKLSSLKSIYIIFLSIIVMGIIIFCSTTAIAADLTINGYDNPCKYNPSSKADGPIPSNVAPCSDSIDGNKNGFKFNSKYYYQTWILSNDPYKTAPARQLIVYGDVNSVGGIQDFKEGWQPGGPETKITNEGHFISKGKRGEYRYLGFTKDGNLFSNVHFIVDSESGNRLASKHWIFKPWEELPSWYTRKPNSPGAVYNNEKDVLSEQFDDIRKYLISSLNFSITQGVKYADRYKVLSDTDDQDPRLYMSINQAPTTREAGFGNMYHYSWSTESLWYHTYVLPKLDKIDKLPVDTRCTAQPVSDKPIPMGKSKTIDVEVKLTGILEDELFYDNPTQKFTTYTRDDVKYWRLDMMNEKTGTYNKLSSQQPQDGVIIQDNKASSIFTIKVDTEKLDRSDDSVWTYRTNAGAYAFFHNHTDGNPAYSFQYCNVIVQVEPNSNATMQSDFGIVDTIQFEKKSSFTSSMVGYQDYSYGQDADYYEFEITNDDDGSTISRTYDPAVPEIKAPNAGYLNQDDVNSYIYQFMLSKFVVEEAPGPLPIMKSFTIKQTIVDRDATVNKRSTKIRNVTVIHSTLARCEPSDPLITQPKQFITPEVSWEYDWYDVVPFPVTDAPPAYIPAKSCESPIDYSEFTREIYIDGNPIDTDAFYAGTYIFGEDQIGLREVTATFTAPDGSVSHKTVHVVIHDSKPRVSLKLEGLYKQNRTMTAIDRSAAGNDQWVEQNAPLEITSFSYEDTNDPNLKCRIGYCESNLSEKMFMYKEPGIYQMSIAAKRVITYGSGQKITRYSDPYLVEYAIAPDHKPAIIAHAYNSQISRLDQLHLYYDVESTDSDFIEEKHLEVYYDSNNDGSFDTKVYETDGDLTDMPTFNKLGQYEIVVDAKEGTTQDRLMEFVLPSDDMTHQIRSYFFVDNYAPSSDLYLDIPNEKPDMDVYFMLDANLEQSKTDYVRNNKVTLTNAFNTANMIANIGIWDMKTYTYDQSASTTQSTGTAYPSSSLYYSSSGYSGTLSRYHVSNNPYTKDEGKNVSKTDTKTGSDSCSNDVVTSYDAHGNMSGSTSWSTCPDELDYNDGQYTGTIDRTGESKSGSCGNTGPPKGTCTVTWTASYKGTVTWTRDVWEPKIVEYDDYTGHYSGTIYKDVRQPYDTSFTRAVPTKYIIYVSDGGATQLSDLQNVMNKHNAHLILVGSNAIQPQISHDQFITNNDPIDEVMGQVLSYIAESNPANPKVYKLINEDIETVTATFDAEHDDTPSSVDQLQITQDPTYYDNALGYESWSGQVLSNEKDDANWKSYESIINLSKPGKYQFIRRIKDIPSTDPSFAMYGYYSNESAIDVYVHRKPIADVTLDFDYIAASNRYTTTWVDKSYDLDHNVTRANTDRGIQARSIKLTNQGTGEVYTNIPDELTPGTYVLDYMAQDIEGVWSDPIQRTYTLSSTVPVQMTSKLKPTYSGFSLNSVPASENLLAYDLWTRYPYAVSMNHQMGGYLNRTVPYYTGSKNGNDISWLDESFTIPDTTPDGTYTFQIRANGSVAGSTKTDTYSVQVVTPINLSVQIDAVSGGTTNLFSILVGDTYKLVAATTKYPNQAVNSNATTVIAFKGTAYQRSFTLTSTTSNTTGYGLKKWVNTNTFTVGSVPDGNYTFEWTSRTPNGNVETVSKTIAVVNNRPPTADFSWSPNPIYEGDEVSFRSTVSDPDHDVLSVGYEITSPTAVKTTYSYNLSYPYSTTAPTLDMDGVGDWSVKMTVSDGKSPAVVVTKTVSVLPLSISGSVSHTATWLNNLNDYNDWLTARFGNGKLTTTQRDAMHRNDNVFWAGERFVLAAQTTTIQSSSTVTAVAVWSEVSGTAYPQHSQSPFFTRDDYLDRSLSTSTPSRTVWRGEVNDPHLDLTGVADNVTLQYLEDGYLDFTFYVRYSNGTVKQTVERVFVRGNWADFYQIHRVH